MKLSLPGLLLIMATAAMPAHPHAEESVTRTLFQVSSSVLLNGLHVIRHHRDISDTFTVQLVVDVGLQDFDCAEQQLPHLLEHMLFEGTPVSIGKPCVNAFAITAENTMLIPPRNTPTTRWTFIPTIRKSRWKICMP